MRRFRLPLAAAGAGTIVLAFGMISIAQDLEGPGVREMAQRLENPGVAFLATAERQPDVDMLAEGRLVAMGGSQRGGAGMACFTCHGASGAGEGSGAFPRLAGMPAWYMYKQLNDYASGARPNDIMTPIAENLLDREREAVSSYYAVMQAPYPRAGEYGGLELQWGGQLAAVGSSEKGIPACVNCHGPQGEGLPPSVPGLAGQYASYTALQLELFRDGTRDNDPMGVMTAIAQKMEDRDIRAVARYYESVRPVGGSDAEYFSQQLGAGSGSRPFYPTGPEPAERPLPEDAAGPVEGVGEPDNGQGDGAQDAGQQGGGGSQQIQESEDENGGDQNGGGQAGDTGE
ncbi:c-type cytochrome [Fodinicurvata sp. EGI_FJ10296]|uniref:c-type cytochrome n=1 Tax=Fodinicurvata sp. EGI_FJ10296 TaxID=3231908 RepID=UPI003453AD2C